MIDRPIQVTVYSDYVCPFCYMGKASLEAAAESEPMEVEWRAFELRPEGAPPMGDDYKQMIESRWESVVEMGAEYGVELRAHRFDVNTRLAHRAYKLMQEIAPAQAAAYHEALFRAYFSDDRDISQPEVLVALAEEVGAAGEALQARLEEEAARNEVLQEEATALRSGITGVPAYVFEGRYLLSGVRPPEEIVKVIRHLRLNVLER